MTVSCWVNKEMGDCSREESEIMADILEKVSDENSCLHREIRSCYIHMIESRQEDIGFIKDLFSEKIDSFKKDRRIVELECENMHLKVELECADKEKIRCSKIRYDVQRENELLKERLKLYQKCQQDDLFQARQRALNKYAEEYDEDKDGVDEIDYAYKLFDTSA